MVIGITGNIGAGKTTFARFLKKYGFKVINADDIGKNLLKKGKPGYILVIKAFGESILNGNREINRKKLASIVFSDSKKLELLTSITHPLIGETIFELRKEGTVFVEAALLIEANWYKKIDTVITVFAYRGQRILRAAGKFGLKEVLKRERFQFSYKDKLKFTDIMICNTKDKLHLLEQTDSFVSQLINE